MTSTGFEPAIPAIQRTQTYTLDGTATGIGQQLHLPYLFMYLFIVHINWYLTTVAAWTCINTTSFIPRQDFIKY